LIVVGTSDISAIAERIQRARVEVERMGACPLSPNFYEGLGAIYEDLYVHISEIEEEINRGNYSVLLRVKEDLDKVKAESEALKSVIKDKCSPFLVAGDDLHAECECPKGTCSGLFCRCTGDGGCWSILGNDNGKGRSNEGGYAPLDNDEMGSIRSSSGIVTVYDVSGRIVGNSMVTLEPGIYFVRYRNGSFNRVMIR